MKKHFLVSTVILLLATFLSGCGSDTPFSPVQEVPPVVNPTEPANEEPPPPAPEPDNTNYCKTNFTGQKFVVVAVSDNSLTSDIPLQDCPSLEGEIRRDKTGIREFVGDLRRISGTKVVFNPRNLPSECSPKVGEELKLIWKP